MILAAVTFVLTGCLLVILEHSDYIPGQRTREKVCGVLAVTVVAGAVLAPNAYDRAIDWYAHRRAKEIQEIVDDLSPDTTVATASAS